MDNVLGILNIAANVIIVALVLIYLIKKLINFISVLRFIDEIKREVEERLENNSPTERLDFTKESTPEDTVRIKAYTKQDLLEHPMRVFNDIGEDSFYTFCMEEDLGFLTKLHDVFLEYEEYEICENLDRMIEIKKQNE